MKRVHAIIRGRVQGVWYRQSTADRAIELGVSGWARNLPDGSVEAVFEGDPAAVSLLIEWCRSGPPMASVTGIDLNDEEPENLPPPFRVRR